MKSVLFIEDDEGVQTTVKKLYQACARKAFHGEVAFISAFNWESAWQLIESAAPDVIIADLVIPPDDLLHGVEKVRRAAETGIPIVVLTGYESREEELRLKCMAAGASDFMLKLKANQRPEDLCERVYLAHLRRIFTNAHGRPTSRNTPAI